MASSFVARLMSVLGGGWTTCGCLPCLDRQSLSPAPLYRAGGSAVRVDIGNVVPSVLVNAQQLVSGLAPGVFPSCRRLHRAQVSYRLELIPLPVASASMLLTCCFVSMLIDKLVR